ncbi:MAG: hypothetical protein NTY38_00390 [Acidobacteria bacterium]|nr:hypothetical protein [Acidobacteriota bacterium]
MTNENQTGNDFRLEVAAPELRKAGLKFDNHPAMAVAANQWAPEAWAEAYTAGKCVDIKSWL